SVGKGEQIYHFPVKPVIRGHLTAAVAGKNHLHLMETGDGFIFIRYRVCTDKGKEGRVEIFGNLFYAAKIKDTQPVSGKNKEVSGMRVRVNSAQFVKLEVINIPKRLAYPVSCFRRRFA